jgi:gluconokinase
MPMSPSLSPESLILAIDVGSSSVRALICDQQGHAVEDTFTQVRHESVTTPDGGSMLDAQTVSSLIFGCIDSVLAKAGKASPRIQVVAMDTLVGNVLGIDSQGQPTTPIYTWADTRGRELVGNLKTLLAYPDYPQRTGCYVHPSYWPLRLLWLQAHETEAFTRTVYWLSLGEYLLYLLFGARRVSLSTASWSGLLNRHTQDWDATTLAALPISREQLSAISDRPFQGLAGAWAERWPALKDAYWLPSIGDGVASNIGTGCTTPQHVALALGTSGALRIIVPGTPDRIPDGLFCYRVDANRSLVGGALSNVGNLYAWMLQTFRLDERPDMDAVIGRIEPDSHGLTILPFLAGERAPGWNDQAHAVFTGITTATTPEHLIRAGLEAIAYRFYQVSARLKLFLPPDSIYITSGAAAGRSPAWLQILADVLGAPIYTTTGAEATIRGTVFFATGQEPSIPIGQTCVPDTGRYAIYRLAIDRQQTLYEKLFPETS